MNDPLFPLQPRRVGFAHQPRFTPLSVVGTAHPTLSHSHRRRVGFAHRVSPQPRSHLEYIDRLLQPDHAVAVHILLGQVAR
jgi:hypothetical protein